VNLLAIDAGSYSIKFMLFEVDRKGPRLLEIHEVNRYEATKQMGASAPHQQLAEIIKSYIGEQFEGKMILQLPNNLTTSRFMTLPVTNRKKVEMMIPFQLDENLPFTSQKAHYFSTLEKHTTETKAIINITKTDDFEQIYGALKKSHVLPQVLTSELAIVQSYIKDKGVTGPMAVLDLGHNTTKCYIIFNELIYSNHLSHTAGAIIDDVIARTYNISHEEAVVYKHQNCFLLTEGQYDEVDEDQKEFALIMKQTLWPLVLEIRRWLLGFRVKYGESVDAVFMTGGSSQIKNLDNFLSQALEVRVQSLGIPDSIHDPENLLENKHASFNMASLMGHSQVAKIRPGNFLCGPYSESGSSDIPLYSTGFIFTRSLAASLVIIFILVLENIFFIQPRIKKAESTFKKISKSQDLGISPSLKKGFKKRYKKVLKGIKKKEKSLNQEVKVIMAANELNVLDPLAELSSLINKNSKLELLSFQTDGILTSAKFKAQTDKDLKLLQTRLKSFAGQTPKLKIDNKKKVISFEVEAN
jgi:general secretion pathway protein L